jgi:hypothetical protein
MATRYTQNETCCSKRLKPIGSRELGREDSDMGLLFHGQDREQNFVKFFVKLCATGTPNTPVRSC